MLDLPRRWVRCLVLGSLLLGTTTACGDGSAAAGQARSPERAASGFLQAVGDGRADDALAYLQVQPTDRTLLTDDVLADAAQPVTQVEARVRGGGSGDSRTVDVSYRIGERRVTDTYHVVRLGTYWFVDESLPTVPAFDDRPDYTGVTVDGRAVLPGTGDLWGSGTPLFPGRYELALDHPLLTVDNAEFTVTGLHQPATLTGDGPHARLTDDGQHTVAAAAQDAFAACLAATTPSTACVLDRSLTLADADAAWSLDPGGTTDLTGSAPSWRRCSGRYDSPTGPAICADGLFAVTRRTARTIDGKTSVSVYPIEGYFADISEPDHIRIVFTIS